MKGGLAEAKQPAGMPIMRRLLVPAAASLLKAPEERGSQGFPKAQATFWKCAREASQCEHLSCLGKCRPACFIPPSPPVTSGLVHAFGRQKACPEATFFPTAKLGEILWE